MTSLQVSRNGVPMVINSIEEILEEASSFYAELYTGRVTSMDSQKSGSFLDNYVNTQLSDSNRAFCESPLTDVELFNALEKLPKGKVPGIDGLPVEFFIFLGGLES
jgi:hypothetical protein